MISLSMQLKNDFIELFSNSEEYQDMLVKEKYEVLPTISYPMITIEELDNNDVNQYFDGQECVSYVSYQFDINAEQSEFHTALENVQIIMNMIDDYMKGDRYRCMRRMGKPVINPLSTDNNVAVGHLRYECYVDIKTNTIYRRY